MSISGAALKTARPVDAVALAHIRRRLDAAPQPPWLHAEAARRMAERLPVVKLQPSVVLDWHAHRGASASVLRQVYPRARVLAVEAAGSAPMPAAAPPRAWWQRLRPAARPLGDDGSGAWPAKAELLWSNMALHFVPDPLALLRQWHARLAVDGFLMFSTLGPGTLQALSALYQAVGWPPPMAPLVDMHDLGDMLVEAGFADPVMDQETLTLHWADAPALLAELRTLGGNAHAGRFAGLRTPRWLQGLLQALAQLPQQQDRPALSFELVYGHAFRPPPRPRVAPVTTLGVDAMREMVKGGSRRRPGAE
jgi:malonyl-CoA O-methyltransferase